MIFSSIIIQTPCPLDPMMWNLVWYSCARSIVQEALCAHIQFLSRVSREEFQEGKSIGNACFRCIHYLPPSQDDTSVAGIHRKVWIPTTEVTARKPVDFWVSWAMVYYSLDNRLTSDGAGKQRGHPSKINKFSACASTPNGSLRGRMGRAYGWLNDKDEDTLTSHDR